MENILDQNLAAVTLKQIKEGLTAYNKAKVGDKICMTKGSKKSEFAQALVNAVAAALDNGEFVRMPEKVKDLYSILVNDSADTGRINKGKAQGTENIFKADVGGDVKPVGNEKAKGRGYTGITRPDAFAQVLGIMPKGQPIQRLEFNKSMHSTYGGSIENATWWSGVYLGILVSLGKVQRVGQSEFVIK